MPSRPGAGANPRPGRKASALDRVLHLTGGLAEVALGLLSTALVLEALVISGLARGLLHLAGGLVDLALHLVTHGCTTSTSRLRFRQDAIPRGPCRETTARRPAAVLDGRTPAPRREVAAGMRTRRAARV